MKTVFYQTFGCQMNIADSSELSQSLARRGFLPTDDVHEADLIVVNTCSVREHAETRARARIREYASIKRTNTGTRLWVIGCMAERLGNALKNEIPDIDSVIGAPELADAESVVRKYLGDFSCEKSAPGPVAERVSDFFPIMRGCDNYCAYCIVPYVRGPEKSIPAAHIIDLITRRAQERLMEATLLGQNVNSYRDGNIDFSDLLIKISSIEGLRRIRFTTSHPKDCNEKLIRTMAGIPKICRHLHLPAQAGSDRILSLMNRKYTVANYRNLVEKARLHMPDCDITTDLMVGFPSESAEEFNQTLDLARDVRFTNAFMFSYSVRAGTAAEKFTDDVPRGEKIDRLNRLISLQTAITKEHYNGMTGRSIEVMLYDRKEKRGKSWMRGQDNGCKRVLVSCPETQAGTILKVIPHSSSGMTLLA